MHSGVYRKYTDAWVFPITISIPLIVLSSSYGQTCTMMYDLWNNLSAASVKFAYTNGVDSVPHMSSLLLVGL